MVALRRQHAPGRGDGGVTGGGPDKVEALRQWLRVEPEPQRMNQVTDAEVDRAYARIAGGVARCRDLSPTRRNAAAEPARRRSHPELGLRQFLEEGGFKAF